MPRLAMENASTGSSVANNSNSTTVIVSLAAFVAWLIISLLGVLGLHAGGMPIAIGIGGSAIAVIFILGRCREVAAVTLEPMQIDAVTGLISPEVFMQILDHKLRRPHHDAVSILLINLANFRAINDEQGRSGGDVVLHLIAQRIKEASCTPISLTRLAGDEFAVALEHENDGNEPRRLARTISEAIALPLTVDEYVLQLRVAIGMATCIRCGLGAQRLVQTASIALGQAKQDKRNPIRAFRPTMEDELRKKSRLVAELRIAIEAGQIVPYYQPVVELATGMLLGFECLARWLHPERGVLGPDIFVPLAEDHDLIDAMTFQVLRQACVDMAAWKPELTLALNISPQQLRDSKLAEKLCAVIVAAEIDPKRFVIEITESSLIGDMRAARSTIAAFKRVGFVVALDDFGTGYASLRHLRELQFDRIKIDRSFVNDIATPDSAQIIRAILSIGRGLGLPVIAEGVETNEQLRILLQFGATCGQGYLYGRPMTAKDALDVIEKPRRLVLLNALGMLQAA